MFWKCLSCHLAVRPALSPDMWGFTGKDFEM